MKSSLSCVMTNEKLYIPSKNYFKETIREDIYIPNKNFFKTRKMITLEDLEEQIISDNKPIKIIVPKEEPKKKKVIINEDDELLNLACGINDKDENVVVKDNVCPFCKQTIEEDTTTCINCGSEFRENVDFTQEWRGYNGEDSKDESSFRCSMVNNMYFQNSNTIVLAGSFNNRMKRIHLWESSNYKDRSLSKIYDYMTEICVKNKISESTIEIAKTMYHHIKQYDDKENESTKVRGIKGLISACVYYASIDNKRPIDPLLIIKMFDITKEKFKKGKSDFKTITSNSDISFGENQFETPYFYIDDFCRKYDTITKEFKQLAIDIARNSIDLCLVTNHTPISIAAGAIMLMADIKNIVITPSIIKKKINISETTINKVYNKLKANRDCVSDNEATKYILKTSRNIIV
jgi:transcription initiation factor TFIIIB Brf1 subunit/transcription initiation factor TFIIB